MTQNHMSGCIDLDCFGDCHTAMKRNGRYAVLYQSGEVMSFDADDWQDALEQGLGHESEVTGLLLKVERER